MRFILFNSVPKTLQFTIEYHAPHWIILIRNPGQKDWSALRTNEIQIVEHDEFGTEIRRRPAIHGFASIAEATEWAGMNLKGAEKIHRPSNDIEKTGERLSKTPTQKNYGLRDSLQDVKSVLSA